MPKRLSLVAGDDHWTAEVSGDQVTLSPGDAAIRVRRADDRVHAQDGDADWMGQAIVDGRTVWVAVEGDVFAFTVARGAGRGASATLEHDAFTPPMAATVVRVLVQPGSVVKDGEVLIALEAMKMEMPIRAPRDGVVKAVHCREGDLVQPDEPLLELE